VSFILPAPSKTLAAVGTAKRSWIIRRPEKTPEFGACTVTVTPFGICTFPTIPPLEFKVVKMIVHDEHVSTALGCRSKLPSVIQYVPGGR